MEQTIYKTPNGRDEIYKVYDEALKNWPVDFETKIIKTKFGDTHVIVSGQNDLPALVLLHGASSNATSWIGEIKKYTKHFQVFAIDMIGEPGKSAQSRPAWESDAYADWMSEVIKGLGLKKINLLGLSQGGWIAIKYASSHPEKVEKLVLLSPGGVVATKGSFLLAAIGCSMLGRWGMNKLNEYVFGKQLDADAVKYMNVIMNNVKPRMDKEYIFTDEELKRLTMPVFLVGGTEDVVRPVDKIEERLEHLVPQFDAIILDKQGHVLMNVAEEVVEWLKR